MIKRTHLTLIYDAFVGAAAFYLALMLRYDGVIPENAIHLAWYSIVYALCCSVVFYSFGLHRNMWRYTSARELIRLGSAVTISLLATGAFIFFMTRLDNFPRSTFVILFLLHIALAAGPRTLFRVLHESPFQRGFPNLKDNASHVLLVGANDAADMFIREINRQGIADYKVHGILDNTPAKQNRLIHNIPVLGTTSQLNKAQKLLTKQNVTIDTLVLTNVRQAAEAKALVDQATEMGISIKRLPNISTLQDGEALTSLKPVLIEDLLGRAPIALDMQAIDNLVNSKIVLVTGAGGSIGSELCRQIAARKPDLLIIADHSEHALYQIDMELKNNFPDIRRQPVLLDVRSTEDVTGVLNSSKVDTIFHAAAYKHVPMVEANPVSGIENNLFGTVTLARCAMEHCVPNMVIISTDKAVNPTNVMGATKRAAEIFCQNQQGKTKFMTVRFGNVLGSTGSVVPLFTKQIQAGGPITVTHKDATRYFMTIPEAVQLVLQSATLGKGGEVFMLDMGEPVKIWDMAEEMVRLSGLTPHKDIEITEVGLRPGEKMYEELWYDEESMGETGQEDIFLVSPVKMDADKLKQQMDAILEACKAQDAMGAVTALKAFVPEYQPASTSPFAAINNTKKVG